MWGQGSEGGVAGCGYREEGKGKEEEKGRNGGWKGDRVEGTALTFGKVQSCWRNQRASGQLSPKFRSGDEMCSPAGSGWLEQGWRRREGELSGAEEASGGFGRLRAPHAKPCVGFVLCYPKTWC